MNKNALIGLSAVALGLTVAACDPVEPKEPTTPVEQPTTVPTDEPCGADTGVVCP